MTESSRRLPRVFSTPALLRILLLVVLVAAAFGAYLLTWVSSREAYFSARNFRILAGLGKQIESILEVESEGLRYGGRGQAVEPEPRRETEVRIAHPDDPGAAPQTIRVRDLSAPAAVAAPAGGPEAALPRLGFAAYPGGAYLTGGGPGSPRRVALEPLVDPVLSRDVFDHVVIADASGNVLFEKDNREVRVASLAGLAPAAAEPGKAADDGQVSARWHDVDLSGTRYEVFLVPLRLAVPRESEKEGAGPWRVCGFVRSDRFLTERLELPRVPLLAFVALLVLLLLAWPLLKVRWMEGWEHLSGADLAWLGATMFLLPALLTVAVWGGWHFHGLTRMVDGTLEELAARIDANLRGEVRSYLDLLAAIDADASPAVDRLAAGEEDPARGADRAATLAAFAGRLGPLPFLDLYWIRRDGCQAYKVNFGPAKRLIRLADREYFRALAQDLRPGSGPAGGPEGRAVYVESIHSWTTGQPELVVSLQRPRTPEVPVVAVSVPLPSLIDAVLPPGFEYAVVQSRTEVQGPAGNARTVEAGEVLLHSDKRRNLRENLFQETTDPAWLREAVAARTSARGLVVYQGRVRRAFVRPLAVADRPWALVVFADADRQTALHAQVVTLALALVALYGTAVALLFLGYSWLFGPRGRDWLWPQAERLPAYGRIAGFLLAVVLIYRYALTASGGADLLLFAALSPVALLAVIHEGLARGPGDAPWRLRAAIALAVALLAGVALHRNGTPSLAAGVWLAAALAVTAAAVALPAPRPALARRARAVENARQRHLLCLLLATVPLAVLPAVAFVEVAFASQLDREVHSGQAELAARLGERERRLGQDIGERFPWAERASAPAGEAEESWECAGWSESFPDPALLPPAPAGGDALASWLGDRLEFARRHGYGSFYFHTCVCRPERGAAPMPPVPVPAGPRPRAEATVLPASAFEPAATLGGAAPRCLCRDSPRADAALRGDLCEPGPGAGRLAAAQAGEEEDDERIWRTRTVRGARQLCYSLEDPGSGGFEPVTLVTRIQRSGFVPSSLSELAAFFVTMVLAAALLFLLARFVAGALFYYEVVPDPEGPEDERSPLHLALRRPGAGALAPPPHSWGWRLVDLRARARERERDADGRRAAHPGSEVSLADEDQVVVVDHFDDDGPGAAAVRTALLSEARGRRLVLLCDRSPGAGEAGGAVLSSRGDRLETVPEGDELARRAAVDPELPAAVERLEQWLFAASGLGERRVLDFVGEALRPVYDARWELLSRRGERGREEKHILGALRRGRWVTAKAGRRLDRLAARGFLVQDPRVRILARSQAIAIRNASTREGGDALRGLAEQSPWRRLRTPLAIVVVLVLAFLFFTQRDLFDNATATVGALGGGAAALLQFLSDLKSSREGNGGGDG